MTGLGEELVCACEVLLELAFDDFVPGSSCRLVKLRCFKMFASPPVGCDLGGSGGSVQGDHLYLIQSSTLKKSTGYSSFVVLPIKQ